MTKILAKDLGLADTVRLGDGPYMDAVVTQIMYGRIRLWRPYMATADFSYAGGVIATIGLEEIELWDGDSRPLILLERKELK